MPGLVWDAFRNGFREPFYPVLSPSRRAELVHGFAAWWLAITTAAFLLIAIVQPGIAAFTFSALARAWVLLGGVLVLNRLGFQTAAGVLLIVGSVAAVTLTALSAGGVHSPGVQSFFVVSFMASLIFSVRGGVATALCCVVIAAALAVLEKRGLLPPPVVYEPWVHVILNGRYVLLFLFALHVSMRVLAEAIASGESELARRRVSEHRLSLTLEAADIGVWTYDPVQGAYFGDERGFAIFGLPRPPDGRFPFERWKSMLHRNDSESVMAAFEALLRGGSKVSVRYRIRLDDGRVRHIEVVAAGEAAEPGRPARIYGLVTDVTEREVLEWDLGERVKEQRCLHRAARLLSPERRFDASVLLDLAALVPPAMSLPEVCSARVAYLGMEGALPNWRRTEWALAAPFSTTRGEGLLEVVYLRDPSDDHGFLNEERELLGSLAEMLKVYLEREHGAEEGKAAQARFIQSQKMEAFGKLAGGVAHDFNNILTVVLGYAQLLAAATPPEDARREDIDEVLKAAERAASLTTRLLAFSRKQTINPKVLELGQVVADTSGMLRRLIGADVRVELRRGPQAAWVLADKGQLDQVLLNLAVNARDAMPEGGTLLVETSVEEKGGVRRVELCVSDTGVGMTDEVKARLFEPFFTTKEAGKGTGLGLSVVYGVVEQNGGTIAVDSAPGRGTRFRITFPLAEPVAEQAGSEAVDEGLGGRGTVLFVDDDATIRRLAARVLKDRGYVVLLAGDGTEALRAAEGHPGTLDLLVTDLVMPRLGGRPLAERLRAARPGLRVLFISGYDGDASERSAVLPADTLVLLKPFTPDTLAQTVRRALAA